MIISTPKGEIELLSVSDEILSPIKAELPFGILRGKHREDGSDLYAIVVKCGSEELWAVKQQPIEVAEEDLHNSYLVNSILIACSLKRYLDHGFGGCLILSQYIRRKAEGVESGVAYFGVPSETGIEANEFPFDAGFDGRLGHGFTRMFTSFIEEFKNSSKETGLSYQPFIGLDVRPRSALETLGFQFMVYGSKIFSLKKTISERDPVWAALRGSGIELVYHLPSVPGEITEDQLEGAKGSVGD